MTYLIDIPALAKLGNVPQAEVAFERVTVVLGINGCGKSTLLNHLLERAGGELASRNPVLVDGGRVAEVPASARISYKERESLGAGLVPAMRQQHRKKRRGKLRGRLQQALYLLSARDYMARAADYEALQRWRAAGAGTEEPVPALPESEFDRLFRLFNGVFPRIQLSRNETDDLFASRDGGERYAITELSDGERQVLSLLLDLIMAAEDNSLIVVDEPEINLHTGLACRFWRTLEDDLPDAVFIYATHCVPFAFRSGVERVYHIAGNGQLVELGELSALPRRDLTDLIGALPALTGKQAVLFCEGEPDGPDEILYFWLVGPDIAVQPVEVHGNVLRVLRENIVLQKLVPGVKVVGIVDRDQYPDGALGKFEEIVAITPLNEVESYLCLPAVISSLSCAAETNLKAAEVEQIVLDDAERRIGEVVSLRLTQLAKKDPKRLHELMKAEEARLRAAIESGDIVEVLRLFPGKECAERIAHRLGLSGVPALAAAVVKEIKVAEHPELDELRRSVVDRLGGGNDE